MNSKNSDCHINMNKENLNTIHEGERLFKCNVCDSSFSQKSALKAHVASYHEGKKPFQCTACNASFAQNVSLKKHVVTVHEGKKPNQSRNRNTARKNTKVNKTELNKIFMREQQEMFDIKFQYTIENGIKKMLGEGGYSSVYEGKCKETNEKVAIKCVTFEEPRILTRKLLSKCDDIEYQLLKKCQGVEGVIKLYDFFQLEKEDIFVLQMPEGCQELNDHNVNFWKHNCDKKHISYESYSRPIIKQAVEILNGCHKKKVFHGDIHLGNFLIDKYGKVSLIDFGLAKTVKKGGFLSCNFKEGPEIFDDYKPPEAYYDTNIHAESVTSYCLGIMLYEMLNGTDCPFGNKEEALHGEFSFDPAFSPECQEIIQNCLEKDPRKRITLSKLEALVHSWMPVSLITAPPHTRVIDQTGDYTPKSATKTATVITRKRIKNDEIVILEVKAKKPKVPIKQEQRSHQRQSHHLPQQQPQQPLQQQPMQSPLQVMQLQMMQLLMMQQQMMPQPLQQQPQQPLQQQPMQPPLEVMQLHMMQLLMMQQMMQQLPHQQQTLQQQPLQVMHQQHSHQLPQQQVVQPGGIAPGLYQAAGAGTPGFNPAAGFGTPGFNPAAGAGTPGFNQITGAGNPGFYQAAGAGPPGFNQSAGTGTPGFYQNTGSGTPGFYHAAGAVASAPFVADPSPGSRK